MSLHCSYHRSVTDGKKLLLTDTNVLGIGSMREYEFQHRSHRGRATAAIHGTFKKLSRLLNAHPDKVPILLWDDRCRWREALLPQYKRHRWETAEQQSFLQSYLAQCEVIQSLLTSLGVPQASCPNFEADDLAGLICRHIEPDWQISLATTDGDWFQALRHNVTWISTRTGAVVTVADLGNVDAIKEGPFLSTDHFVQAKALAGDPSDGIPGVPGVGLKTAAKILREHGTIEALWAKYDANDPIKGVAVLRAAGPEYRGSYLRNLRLVDWRLAPPLTRDFRLEFKSPDRALFSEICDEWGLEEIRCSWEGFCVPWQAGSVAMDTVRSILNGPSL